MDLIKLRARQGGVLHLYWGQVGNLPPAKGVIIFILKGDSLLIVENPVRGWEIPGGTIEAGEDELITVHREAYEETGCTLTEPFRLGQYSLVDDQGLASIEVAIYFAQIREEGCLPIDSEIKAVDVLKVKEWLRVKEEDRFSKAMKDHVFFLALGRIKELGLVSLKLAEGIEKEVCDILTYYNIAE